MRLSRPSENALDVYRLGLLILIPLRIPGKPTRAGYGRHLPWN